ncbi:hypothetical protein MJ570_19775 [Escherichia coli]|nr:hypothetical protein MJ570_19775 [Escherichia coli]
MAELESGGVNVTPNGITGEINAIRHHGGYQKGERIIINYPPAGSAA